MITYSSFHFQTSWTNFSRPRSWRVFPSSRCSFFSTTTCVAIPAWSQPGLKSTVFPCIRCLKIGSLKNSLKNSYQRLTVSSTVVAIACPKCKVPVMFGGGITIVNWPFGFGTLKTKIFLKIKNINPTSNRDHIPAWRILVFPTTHTMQLRHILDCRP